MKEPPIGEWTFLATVLTDKTGRITYKVTDNLGIISTLLFNISAFQIPEKEKLGYGVYPVKMVVRGDHTLLGDNVKCYFSSQSTSLSLSAKQMAVVPSQTEAVIFSIGKNKSCFHL